MSQDEGRRRNVPRLDEDIADVVRQVEQARREMAGEFLIRTKGHLDRLARAGLDTRIVRELVTLHTLAVMACDTMERKPVDSDDVMEQINCAAYFEPLDRPTTAGEAAMFAERKTAEVESRAAARGRS